MYTEVPLATSKGLSNESVLTDELQAVNKNWNVIVFITKLWKNNH